jgi:hypothetical protein
MNELELKGNTWCRNTVVGGIELFVDRRPANEVAQELEQSGWRWSNSTQSWYHRDTPDNVEFARGLCTQLRRAKPR